jgi:SMODS-associated and fused to various effectors sensor domain
MSISYIPEHVKCRLWGRAAGRCQYRGCNHPLWQDDVTKAEFNKAYIAHIIADKPDGPRGDPVLSVRLKADLSNLMLLCDPHHRLADVADVAGHPVDLLRAMKAEHEERIARISGIGNDRQSEVLLYGANIGEHVRLPAFREAALAMLPEWYPARDRATTLGLLNSWQHDHEPEFWSAEAEQLRRGFAESVRPLLRGAAPPHLSVFALAPQPLLMLLGMLLCDLAAVEVYQLHREPAGWAWQADGEAQPLHIVAPREIAGPPALVLALSGTVVEDRIRSALGPSATIWTVTIDRPNNDYLKTRGQLQEFRERLRGLLDRIKATHGQGEILHVFPAAPAAVCVELGRVLMPKADVPLRVYDENKRLGGFSHALDLNTTGGER